MSEKGNTKSSEYVMLTPKERQTQVDKLLKVWNDFILVNEPTLNKDDVFINQRSLAESASESSILKFFINFLTYLSSKKLRCMFFGLQSLNRLLLPTKLRNCVHL